MVIKAYFGAVQSNCYTALQSPMGRSIFIIATISLYNLKIEELLSDPEINHGHRLSLTPEPLRAVRVLFSSQKP